MWRNCKLGIAVIFGFVVLRQWGVFAQEDMSYCKQSTICGTAPVEFTMMLSFAQELITTIKTVGTQWEYLWRYVNPNWFVGTVFAPPEQNIIGRAATNVGQKMNYLAATTAIFVSPKQRWWIKELLAGILVLFHPDVFARDLKRIEQLQSDITQKRYELGIGGWWSKTVRAENVALLQKVIDGYVAKWLLRSASIVDGMTYNDVTAVASTIANALSMFLSTANTDYLLDVGRSNGIRIIWGSGVISSMEKQYACARSPSNICSTDTAKFQENMKALGQDAWQKAEAAFHMFRDDAKRLLLVFDENPPKQDALLTAYYGNQRDKDGKIITLRTGNILSQWRSISVEQQVKNTAPLDQVVASETASDTSLGQTFASWVLDRMVPLIEHQQNDLALAYFSEVKDFSYRFDTLGKAILGVKNVIGNKDAENSLISLVWQACEMQCGWLLKKCY